MDAIQEQFNRPIIAGVVGLVIGMIVGLGVLGWGLFPLEYTDAFPEHLTEGQEGAFNFKEDYLRMAIDSYGQFPDNERANQRFRGLGVGGPEILADIATNPGTQSSVAISQYSLAVQGKPPSVEEGAIDEPPSDGILSGPLGLLCGLSVLLAAALGVAFYIRRQQDAGPAPTVSEEAVRVAEEIAPGEEPPLAQFMTTYMLGDDLFDDSFSIDSPAGEFLGECGIGIAETIGVGEPKRVSSFEVWLFDKNDIQTVTKVLMSSHVFGDEATRERLAAKGEPVLSEPGSQVTLETATLELVARVVDMSYGEGALPPESFFERLTLELAVWPKEQV
jgi:hypothetical protein